MMIKVKEQIQYIRDDIKDNKYNIITAYIIYFILGVILTLKPIVLIGFMLTHILYYTKVNNKKRFLILSIILLVLTVIQSIIFGIAYRNIVMLILSTYVAYNIYDVKINLNKCISNICVIISPIIILFIVEYMQNNLSLLLVAFVGGLNLGSTAIGRYVVIMITLAIIYSTYFIIQVLTRNKKIALYINSSLYLVLGLINMCVLNITLRPLIPSDIFIAGTAVNVIKNQTIPSDLIFMLIKSLIIITAYFILIHFAFKNKETCEINFSGSILGLAVGIAGIFVVSALVGNINTILLKFNSNYAYGFIYHFVTEFYTKLEEPLNYEDPLVNTLVSEDDIVTEYIEASENNPNIIFVMSEAFTDFNRYYDLETNADVIPYFHSLQEEFPNGTLYSSVFGNNTVSSEFEALTGISTGFSDKGANVYQRFMPDELYTLKDYYNSLGYKSGLVHACAQSNYNRINVYNQMNYDIIRLLEQMPENIEMIRNFVTDEENFKEVKDVLDDTKEPLFLMNITIQNHGPYHRSYDGSIKITDDNNNKEIETYLNLLNKSDKDLKNFLESLNEPTIVVIFGDHQPLISGDFYKNLIGASGDDLNFEESVNTYKVPYLIWNNFEYKSDYTVPKEASINYLHMIVNKYLKNPDTEWLNLLEDIFKEFPVITYNFVIDNENKILSIEEIKMEISKAELTSELETLRKYQFACYSMVSNKNK